MTNENKIMYICKLRKGYHCILTGVKPTGSIKGDIVGPRYCIQPMLVEHKRSVNCNKKALVEAKQENL
ncbi:MAG: hypothetical protein ACD_19C00021G0010 [uncultured bacterium]|nr:MAG: hypothetical protein ACD_19C00021G0010 [uncultured bacterium]